MNDSHIGLLASCMEKALHEGRGILSMDLAIVEVERQSKSHAATLRAMQALLVRN